MAKRVTKQPGKIKEPEAAKAAATNKIITLTEYYSKRQEWVRFRQWLVGTSPLICHAWSEKAKREMLAKQVKAVKPSKEDRKPDEEFAASLYDMGNGKFGFPVTAVKKAILSVAHKDRGIPKTAVMAGLWLDFEIVQQRPALAGALCDMPIVRIFGSQPQMREDMVRIGGRAGKSTANFAYRAQFSRWAIRLSGKLDPQNVPPEVLIWLLESGGTATGLGDWRNERSGVFGAFRPATAEEAKQWDKFALGKGPLPPLALDDVMLEAAE